jgi:integral membrane protein
VTRLFTVYRVLALIVGVLLIVGTVGSVLKYLLPDGSALQQLGEDLTPVWLIHGWIYIVYVVVAFVLTQKARWTIPQFLLMMVAGLIPGLIFWVERRVAAQLRAEHPELDTVS